MSEPSDERQDEQRYGGFSTAPTIPMSSNRVLRNEPRRAGAPLAAALVPWYRDFDAWGMALLTLGTGAGLLLVPDLSGRWLEPTTWAVVGTLVTFAAVLVLRGRHGRGSRGERALLAAFLFLMPTVYVAMALRAGAPGQELLTEVAAQWVFGALAVLGFLKSPWFLAAGILAHGLCWDAWHLDPGSTPAAMPPLMPPWYAAACLVLDVGWGWYAVAQVEAFLRRGRA